MERELIRIGEAAKRLSIGRTTAYDLAKRGELPGIVRIGKTVRVSVRALDRFIDDQTSPDPKAAA